MSVILKHDLEKFKQKTSLMKKQKSGDYVNYYKSPYSKTMEVEEGGSLFSGIGTLAKSGINFIGNNKDIIGNVAKGVGSVGSAASSIARAVESKNKLQQLQKIEELRNKALERQKQTLSEKTKNELKNKLGNGIVRVI